MRQVERSSLMKESHRHLALEAILLMEVYCTTHRASLGCRPSVSDDAGKSAVDAAIQKSSAATAAGNSGKSATISPSNSLSEALQLSVRWHYFMRQLFVPGLYAFQL